MDEPADDLERRLARLAPPVDVDAALTEVRAAGRRRQVRQRGVAAGALLLVVVVLSSSMVLARQSDETDVVASQPDSEHPVRDRPGTTVAGSPGTSTPSGDPAIEVTPDDPTPPDPGGPTTGGPSVPTTGGPAVGDPDPSQPPIEQPTAGPLARPDEIDVVITPERTAVPAGERVRFRVDVTNRSSERALFHSGGCGPIEAVASGPNGTSGRPAAVWDGVSPFAAFAQANDTAARPMPTDPRVGAGVQFCTADLRSDPLAPGATTSRSYVFDAVVAPGRSGPPAPVSVTAGVDVILGPGLFGPVERRTASATVVVTDDPRAHASPSAFLAQVGSSPIFEQWVLGHPPISDALRYSVTLSYANGGFELFVDQYGYRLRVRGDVTTGAITEMRSIRAGDAPGDDPDATPLNGPDEILFPT